MDKRIIEETPSTELLNDDWLIKDSPTGGTSKILGSDLKDAITGDIEDSIDKILDSIATEWRANESYSNGTYVMYEGELYVCFVNGSTVGQFKKNTEWLHRNVNSMVTKVIRMIAQRFYASTVSPPSITPYSKGDLVWYSQPYHEDELYICKQDLPNGDTEWVPEHWDKVTDISGLSKYLMDKIAEAGQIDDVQVKTTGDYESVVDENKVAKIDLSNMLIEKSVPNLPQPIASFSDGAEDLPLKSLTASIVPVQNLHGYDNPWVGGAGKNKFAGSYYNNYMSENNGVFTNTESDTQSVFRFIVQAFNGSDLIASSSQEVISSSGRYYVSITISSSVTSLKIKHNGSSKDVGINCQFTATGTFTISLNVTKANPSTVGGLEFKDVQIESGSQMTSYAPYSNICPISGWTEEVVSVVGKNWFNIGTVANWGYSSGVELAISNNTLTYKIVADGLTMATNTNPIYKKGNVNISFTASKTYSRVLIKLRKLDDSGWMTNADASIQGLTYNSFYGGWFVDNTTTDVSRSVNIPLCKYWVLGLGYNNTSVVVGEYETISNVQVENGTTKTEYREYNGTTTTIPFTDGQGNPHTSYGGIIECINGPLTDVREKVLVKDLSWILNSDGTFQSLSLNGENRNDSDTIIMCSTYKYAGIATGNTDSYNKGNNTISVYNGTDKRIYIRDDNYNNTTSFIQAMGDTEIVYELITTAYETYQQQPTSIKSLDGENIVSASTGDVTKLDYIANATDVIANLEARVTALENA